MFKFPWTRKRTVQNAESHREQAPVAIPVPSADIPPQHVDNPATGPHLVLRDEGGHGADFEIDMTSLLLQALAENDMQATRQENALFMDNGLVLQTGFLSMEGENGRIRSSTVVQANHPRLCPDGVFEFQHAIGSTPEEALLNGFRSWIGMDLIALDGALQEQPEGCMTMEMNLANGRKRRIVLSPFTHYMAEPPAPGTDAAEEVDKYCPCCLFTNALEALMPVIEREGTLGLRLFAAMNDGAPQSDCRVNGEDLADAAEALRIYVSSWLPKGDMEFRKQYAVIHDIATDPANLH